MAPPHVTTAAHTQGKNNQQSIEEQEEKQSRTVRLAAMQAYMIKKSPKCKYCAKQHVSHPVNLRPGQVGISYTVCHVQAATERFIMTTLQRDYRHLPRGSNIAAPANLPGRKQWHKDVRTGNWRPRRMIDDMWNSNLNNLTPEQMQALNRPIEDDEDDYDGMDDGPADSADEDLEVASEYSDSEAEDDKLDTETEVTEDTEIDFDEDYDEDAEKDAE